MKSYISRNDENIKEIQLYNYKKPLYYGYVGPFLALYLAFAILWGFKFGIKQHLELGLIFFVLIMLFNLLTFLFCIWSVNVRSALLCNKVENIAEAKYAKIYPLSRMSQNELVKLHCEDSNLWLEYQKIKYLFDFDKKQFKLIEYPINEPYSYYLTNKGLLEESNIYSQEKLYGPNKLTIDIPEFMELMKKRSTSPFFIFQVLCVALWSLYDQFYYSLFTLFMLVVFEATLVKQQLKNMSEIRKMGNKSYMIYVYRNRRWRYITTDELLPGDVCSIARNRIVPCDVLLLKGTCIVDESMLTGESVPQPKESIENENSATILDLANEETAKLRILYGGTYVVQTLLSNNSTIPTAKTNNNTISTPSTTSNIKTPDNGCLGYVLKTGFATSQGKLLRTILCGVNMRGGTCTMRGSTENFETACFIMLLLVFALIASAYVWIHGFLDPNRNRYKLLLECVLIITSVVPPELPIELSLAINSSLIALTKLSIFCTEPFRIPFAGKLDVCCFDKTGTLTTDNFHINGVIEYENNKQRSIESPSSRDLADDNDSSAENEILKGIDASKELAHAKPLKECSTRVQIILGCCHSLVNIVPSLPKFASGFDNHDDQENRGAHEKFTKESASSTNIGDPLEKAILATLGWNLTKNDIIIPSSTFTPSKSGGSMPEKLPTMKIQHRYHFQSSLKRMSVIISYADPHQTSSQIYEVLVKGAPEVLKPMFSKIPEDYEETYLRYAQEGCRILALGYAPLPSRLFQSGNALNAGPSIAKNAQLSRQNVEANLTFCGFLLVSCPLKPDTSAIVKELIRANHKIIMITGDNHLTACHVARELNIVSGDIYYLDVEQQSFIHGHPDKQTIFKFINTTNRKSLSIKSDSSIISTSSKHHSKSSHKFRENLYFNAKTIAFTYDSFENSAKLASKFELCLTGPAFDYLQSALGCVHYGEHGSALSRNASNKALDVVLQKTRIFARFTPKQKELIISAYNRLGKFTLMCGDGTNDVGALKSAHIGVSLLSHGGPPSPLTAADTADRVKKLTKALESQKSALEKRIEQTQQETNALCSNRTAGKRNNPNPFINPNKSKAILANSKLETKKKIAKLMEDLDKDAGNIEPEVVKLGDASIAAPFTSKHSSIQCVCHIIKQGRCTLVTTLQMYTILALNALILAYSQSVLYLEGVKFSDTQSTIQGLLLAACFLSISRSKPLKKLSVEKPLPNIFNVCTIATILFQFAVHFSCLIYLFKAAVRLSPPKESAFLDLEATFKPNLINSTIYVISLTLQVSTFVINYRGKPFMESLFDNKALLYSLIAPVICVVLLTLNLSPNFTQYLEIVEFPYEFKYVVLAVLAIDIGASYAVNFIMLKLFGSR